MCIYSNIIYIISQKLIKIFRNRTVVKKFLTFRKNVAISCTIELMCYNIEDNFRKYSEHAE